MIDRYLLRYFLAVIDQGNFSRAAQHCRVSQPTLSIGIARLETLLDRSLFNRTNRRVELTAAGTRFAVHARRIEAEFVQAERRLDDAGSQALLRIGILATLPAAWIGQGLAAAGRSPADDRIEIVEGRARELAPMLDRQRVDAVLGIVADDGRAPPPLLREGYAMAMASDHPLAARESVAAEELGGEAMIVRRHCEVLAETSRFFTSRGIRPFMAARTTDDDHALAYVRAGLGITLMPRSFACPGVAMPALAGFTQKRDIGFRFGPSTSGRIGGSPTFRRFAEAIAAAARAA